MGSTYTASMLLALGHQASLGLPVHACSLRMQNISFLSHLLPHTYVSLQYCKGNQLLGIREALSGFGLLASSLLTPSAGTHGVWFLDSHDVFHSLLYLLCRFIFTFIHASFKKFTDMYPHHLWDDVSRH
ncbi:hypothetical protein DFH27DRAFT_277769 [Peziza echinospora]|nr:hypothetical protein DFH27DRAFT_277769 [Peziza echinospora]